MQKLLLILHQPNARQIGNIASLQQFKAFLDYNYVTNLLLNTLDGVNNNTENFIVNKWGERLCLKGNAEYKF